jgi:hypothetical protein
MLLTPEMWWNKKTVEERKIWLKKYSLSEIFAMLSWHKIDGTTRARFILLWNPKIDI